jgi:hypothetical protein
MSDEHSVAALTPVSIWDELDIWAKGLQQWQRYVLAQIVRHGKASAEHINDAFILFLNENELRETKAQKPEIPDSITGRAISAGPMPLRILKLRNLQNVNAIPPTAELTFSKNLTVVFGNNGTGKSGFARVFANSCFSRNKPKILPNIFSKEKPSLPSAQIVVQEGRNS